MGKTTITHDEIGANAGQVKLAPIDALREERERIKDQMWKVINKLANSSYEDWKEQLEDAVRVGELAKVQLGLWEAIGILDRHNREDINRGRK